MRHYNEINKQKRANLTEVLSNKARFKFQLGLDFEELEPLRARVDEAYVRLVSIGFIPIPKLEEITRPIDFTSIYSTNAIEGGQADLELVKEIITGHIDKPRNETERRIKNLYNAYRHVEKYFNPPRITQLYPPLFPMTPLGKLIRPKSFVLQLSEKLFQDLNKFIMSDLPLKTGKPGVYRNDPREAPTMVDNTETGGTYKPPRKEEYIKQLMKAFVGWMNTEPLNQLSALYRAPLTHLYYELIHPFNDGNGRVGRLVEITILGHTGYEHAGKLMSDYYFKNIEKYFTLFNECRKKIEKNEEYPNTQFIKFFLEGMLSSINYLHDRANEETANMYYLQHLHDLVQNKKINDRQYHLMKLLLSEKKHTINITQLKEHPAYKGIYYKVTKKTQTRDLKMLLELNLLEINADKKIEIKFISPAINLSSHPFCNTPPSSDNES